MQGLLETPGLTVAGHLVHGQVKEAPLTLPGPGGESRGGGGGVRSLPLGKIYLTSGFWPRVRARALRAPVFLGFLTRQTGRCAPPRPSQLRCSPKNKKSTITRYKNLSLLARTWAARGVYFSTGLSCTLLSYIAFY
jgi:hypothetical protein